MSCNQLHIFLLSTDADHMKTHFFTMNGRKIYELSVSLLVSLSIIYQLLIFSKVKDGTQSRHGHWLGLDQRCRLYQSSGCQAKDRDPFRQKNCEGKSIFCFAALTCFSLRAIQIIRHTFWHFSDPPAPRVTFYYFK